MKKLVIPILLLCALALSVHAQHHGGVSGVVKISKSGSKIIHFDSDQFTTTPVCFFYPEGRAKIEKSTKKYIKITGIPGDVIRYECQTERRMP